LQKRIEILRSYFRVSDGGRSSMVEPQIVVLVVAGSSPVGHPALHSQIANFNASDSWIGVWFTQEKTPRKPLAFGKLKRRWWKTTASIEHVSAKWHNDRITALCPAKTLQHRNFFIDATFHICNLARHVHNAQRHMAIFCTITIAITP
jgi:hypothetical protein